MRKPIYLLLGASLAANVALSLALRSRPPVSLGAAAPSSARPESPAAVHSNGQDVATSSPGYAAFKAAGASPRTQEFATLAAQLRNAGITEDFVEIAVGAVINLDYKRRRVLLGIDGPGAEEFWLSQAPSARPPRTPEQTAAARELQREMNDTLRALFGPAADMTLGNAERRALYGLPREAAEKLHRVFLDYHEMAGKVAGAPDNLALLAREKRADIERVLTPTQLLEFDLRHSLSAGSLRDRFGAFRATEAEFRALFPAYSAAIDTGLPAPQMEERLEAELRRVLGPARFAEWQAANGPGGLRRP